MSALFVVLLVALAIVSAKSLAVLGARSPWTSLGWWATIVYCLMTVGEIVRRIQLAWHLPYACLGALAVAFAVAGIRHEAQADPWWWPMRAKGPVK